MAGYKINLYRYVRVDDNEELYQNKIYKIQSDPNEHTGGQSEDSGMVPNKNGKKRNFIVYGEYDRMEISTVSDFPRFRDVSEDSRSWIGERQSILLYELPGENEISYIDTDEGGCFQYLGENTENAKDFLFIGLTIFQFKNSQKANRSNIDDYLVKCKNNIKQITKEEENLVCEVFGTLGSFGLAVLWLTDQYTDVLRIVNILKMKNIGENIEEEKHIFLSAFTLFAHNHIDDIKCEDRIQKIKGKALVHLTLKTNIGSELVKKLENVFTLTQNELCLHSVGEYDLVFSVPACKIYSKVIRKVSGYSEGQNENILDYNNEFFKKHILQSNTNLCSEKFYTLKNESVETDKAITGNESKKDKLEECNGGFLEESFQLTKDSYSNLRTILNGMMPKTVGMIDTLDLLYSDYASKISTATNVVWAEDFSYQFSRAMQLLEAFVSKISDLDMTKEEAYMHIQEVFNNLKQQIFHVEESNNLVLDTPACHLRYTGHSNLALYAYLGMIKEVIYFAYGLQEINRQSELAPLLTVDATPIITSSLPMDYKEFKNNRFLVINLPVTALYELPIYRAYLHHEIFHYIVPADRYIRDQWIGALFTAESLYGYLRVIVYSIMEKNNYSDDRKERYDREAFEKAEECIRAVMHKYIISYVVKHYGAFHHDYVVKDAHKVNTYKNQDLNEGIFFLNSYILELSGVLEAHMRMEPIICHGNFIIRFLKALFEKKTEFCNKIKIWLEHNGKDVMLGKDILSVELFGEFFQSINGVIENINENNKAYCYRKLIHVQEFNIDDIFQEALDVVSAVKEISCDIPMVNLSSMPLEGFFLMYAKVKYDLLLTPDKNSIQDILRVGVIVDYMFGNENDGETNQRALEGIRADFVASFIGLYFSTSKAAQEKSKHFLILKNKADEWFNGFVNLYKQYCWKYKLYLELFEKLCYSFDLKNRNKKEYNRYINDVDCGSFTEYYKQLVTYGKSIIREMEKDVVSQENVMKCKTDMDTSIFKLNINLIHRFMSQRTFKELKEYRKKCYENKAEKEYQVRDAFKNMGELYPIMSIKVTQQWAAKDFVFYANSLNKLNILIRDISEYLKVRNRAVCKTEELPLWYRGQISDKYVLLPSLMRTYRTHGQYCTLAEYQKAEYEEFKFRADGMMEIMDQAAYTYCDYFALMQHYSVPTTFMDWSEDALTSLYFALEPFFDSKKEMPEEDAVVYIFSPCLYNRARSQIIDRVGQRKLNRTRIDDAIIDSNTGVSYTIPNLSVRYNEKHYSYLLWDEKYKKENVEFLTAPKLETQNESLYLPMAIYSSRLNHRIQAQSGMFLAFNLYTMSDEDRCFDYISLERIQEFYLEEFQSENQEEIKEAFLFKIVIKKDIRQKISDWLKALGLSKERIYPELANVGERVGK